MHNFLSHECTNSHQGKTSQDRRVMKYDVVVVGGGPAGAIAAKISAEKGLKTLLVEKRSQIGDPVRCGEGLNKAVCKEFGIKPAQYFNRTDFFNYVSPGGKVLRLNFSGYTIDRRLFDNDLVNNARDNGAELWLRSRASGIKNKGGTFSITIKRDGESIDIHPEVIIAADGVESEIAKMAGIPATLKLDEIGSAASAVVEGLDIEKNVMIEHYLKDVPLGYFWIFPKSENVANVGVGWIMKHTKGFKPVDLLQSYLKNTDSLKGGKIRYYTSGGVPATLRMEKLFYRNILFTGDAAHLSNPMTGEGVTQAMLSGRLAAEVSNESISLDKPGILSKYESEWEKIKLGNIGVQDTQYGLYIVQKTLLSLPQATKEEIMEELWSFAIKNNQYPFSINVLKNKKMSPKILGIIMKNRRLRNWALKRFLSFPARKLGI